MDFEKLKEAFQISKNESVIVTFRVPLSVNDRALPFGKFNIKILDDVNYDLYAEVKAIFRSDFPELEHAELKHFWENVKKKDIIPLDQEEARKLTLDELKGVMKEMAGLTYDFNVKSVPRSDQDKKRGPQYNPISGFPNPVSGFPNSVKYSNSGNSPSRPKYDSKYSMDKLPLSQDNDWSPDSNSPKTSKSAKRPRLDSQGSSIMDSSPDSSRSNSPDSENKENDGIFAERKDFNLHDFLVKEFPHIISNPNKDALEYLDAVTPRGKSLSAGNKSPWISNLETPKRGKRLSGKPISPFVSKVLGEP